MGTMFNRKVAVETNVEESGLVFTSEDEAPIPNSMKKTVATSDNIKVTDITMFLRRDRSKTSVGFASATVVVKGLDINLGSLSIMRDQETGAFNVRTPMNLSANKRIGASNQQCPMCEGSMIIPPADADLEDMRKPWVNKYPYYKGAMVDHVVQVLSGLIPDCDRCTKLKDHNPDAYKALLKKKQELLDSNDVDGLIEIQKEIDKTLVYCGAFNKVVKMTDEGEVECSAFDLSMHSVLLNQKKEVDELVSAGTDAYDARKDTGEDVPF